MKTLIIIFMLVLIGYMVVRYFNMNRVTDEEHFDIPLRTSSAWDWNLGPGYGAGYGTGYAMWGIWPSMIANEPWKNWMWARRPQVFFKPYTPAPQIDYNDAPDNDSLPESNYNISLLPGPKISVNGFARKTLQLDRGRNYYFHVYSPGAPFVIHDGKKPLFEPVENATIDITFDEGDPKKLYYDINGVDGAGGRIYLNSTRWE